jgi:glyoxylase-like metal-dependent hydrolase (beta-lactamase superfamily II)
VTGVTTFNVGGLRCHALEAGIQWLDGGAMFGVVPKPLWEDRCKPDESNRIQLALRCLLVEHQAGPVLIDTGLGDKEKKKFLRIYGVDNAGDPGPTQLEDSLRQVGFEPDDVRYVINTHLHFDHAGGNTMAAPPFPAQGQRGQREQRGHEKAARLPNGQTAQRPDVSTSLSFPNATHVVQRGELEFARQANERTAASYLKHNFEPVAEAGRWELAEGELELLPGIRLLPTPGHTPHHQSVLIKDGGDTACFPGDLIPTAAHVPLPWIMGYDLEPLVTLETKRHLLARAEAEGWVLVFEHDPRVVRGRVTRDSKSFSCNALDTLGGPA